MLANVNSYLALGSYGALNVISWKYTFKRLNEEYEIANKKKQALDNLFVTGKISQATRDSFTGDISSAIIEIEKQRQELAEKMQAKTQQLEGQLKILETLLANYEIQHVVGEIDDEIYTREINLLGSSLETTRNELGVVKQATDQLFPTTPPIQELSSPELVAPIIEDQVPQPVSVETVPLEVSVEAPPIESVIVETSPVEPVPVEAEIETMQEEAALVEGAPIEFPVEVAQAEAAPVEAEIETMQEEAAPVEAEIETMQEEAAPVEADPIITSEPEIQSLNEAISEPALQEPIINMEAAAPVEQPSVEVPLQAFEVTEQEPIETTLEKVMEPVIEPTNDPIMGVEAHVPAHPLEAPHQAPSEVIPETDGNQDIQIEESEENTDTTE